MLDRFFSSEDGAVTLDWVVLAAGVTIIAVLVAAGFEDSTSGIMDRNAIKIEEVGVKLDAV